MPDRYEVSVGWADHWKTACVAQSLGVDGLLGWHRLWAYAAENRIDGDLGGLSDRILEGIAKWTGEPGKFVRVLSEVRAVDGCQGHRSIHDWAERNPWVTGAQARKIASITAANARWTGEQQAEVDPQQNEQVNAPRMRGASGAHAKGNALRYSGSPEREPESERARTRGLTPVGKRRDRANGARGATRPAALHATHQRPEPEPNQDPEPDPDERDQPTPLPPPELANATPEEREAILAEGLAMLEAVRVVRVASQRTSRPETTPPDQPADTNRLAERLRRLARLTDEP